jgi:lysophospholipase L1-like esterase
VPNDCSRTIARVDRNPLLLGGILTLAGVGILYSIKHPPEGAIGCVPSVHAGDRVLLVGDSLSVGLKTPMQALATKTGASFASFTESGTTMRRWINDAQVSATLQNYLPTLVLVCLGTNDSAGNTPNETLAGQVTQMRDWLTSTGAKIVWILPPKLPFPDRVGPAVTAAGIASFPSSTLPIPQPDGIHTSGRGYAGWAEHVWAYLSCSPAPAAALAGLGAAPRRPMVPGFMVRARPPQTASHARKTARKRRRA